MASLGYHSGDALWRAGIPQREYSLLAKGPGQASFSSVLSFLRSRKSWLLKGLRGAPNMEHVEKEGTRLAVEGPGGLHASKL